MSKYELNNVDTLFTSWRNAESGFFDPDFIGTLLIGDEVHGQVGAPRSALRLLCAPAKHGKLNSQCLMSSSSFHAAGSNTGMERFR